MLFQEKIGGKVDIEMERVGIENAIEEFCHKGELPVG